MKRSLFQAREHAFSMGRARVSGATSVLHLIGGTPLLRLRRLGVEVRGAEIYAKAEWKNPGGSVKDRPALAMIEQAEQSGALTPKKAILDATSGNTGIAYGMIGAVKGYRVTLCLPENASPERIRTLHAYGVDLRLTSALEGSDGAILESRKIAAREGDRYFYPDQYSNPANWRAHYRTTAVEILDQTGGRITQLVVGVGTGGTVSGVGRYLKARNPKIKVWGIDTYGSVFKKYKETGIFDKHEIYPYITEGIGEDFLPRNVDFEVIDHFEKVTDKDAAIMTRRIAREEGIFAGNSAGSAMAGLLQLRDRFTDDDVIVVIFHDHGSRYLGKMFNDDWMREKGFIEKHGLTARDLVATGVSGELQSIESNEPVEHAVRVMAEHDFSQISITSDNRLVGSLNETQLYTELVRHPGVKTQPVETIMQPAFPFVDSSTPVDLLQTMITPHNPAVLVRDFKTDKTFIITRSDLIRVI